jgi:hypothetical protein
VEVDRHRELAMTQEWIQDRLLAVLRELQAVRDHRPVLLVVHLACLPAVHRPVVQCMTQEFHAMMQMMML